MTYGGRGENNFGGPTGSGLENKKYYAIVESEGTKKGQITIKERTAVSVNTDRTVGVIPLDNSFKPSSLLSTPESKYFSSTAGQKAIKNQGVITAKKGGLSQQQASQLIFPNTSTSSGPGSAGTAPPAPILPPPGATTDIRSLKPNVPPNLRYPLEINVDEQDYIRFEVWTLNKKSENSPVASITENLKAQEAFGIKGDESLFTKIGENPIIMGIQGPITDSNTVDWGPGSLNELQRILAESSAQVMGSTDNFAKAFFGEIGDITSKLNNYQGKQLLYNALLEQAIGVPGLLSRTTGGVLNPNMELLFQGPQLRPFNFTFKMTPREKSESDNVKGIIKVFKKNMSPVVNNLFLRAPNVFKITYVHGGRNNPHKSINLIKMCALQNCSVDYTPLGTYMTIEDGEGGDSEASMVSYTMNLTFTEINPVYYNDYDVDTHSIGF